MKLYTFLISATLLSIHSFVYAEEIPPNKTDTEKAQPVEDTTIHRAQERLDKSKDKKLNQDEVIHARNKAFDQMDDNHDHSITKEEFYHAHKKRYDRGLEQRFKRLDTDHDGKLSDMEFRRHGRLLKKYDHNKDGTLSESELRQQRRRNH